MYFIDDATALEYCGLLFGAYIIGYCGGLMFYAFRKMADAVT
jgi:hypothetical protein